jgi:hypothetical protein
MVGLPVAVAGAQSTPPIGAYTTAGAWSFVSAPKLHPPKLSTDAPTKTKQLASGYFLTASFPNITTGKPMTGQSGPLILDSQLRPVWFLPLPTNVVALDLKQQTFGGKPALSWWQGVVSNTGATVSGTVEVVNQHYRKVASLTGADGWVISPHDVVISGRDAWVTSYKYLPGINLSSYGGATSGTLYDFAVQEYSLTTGKLLYTWDAYNPGGTPNVPLSESCSGAGPTCGNASAPPSPAIPWDAYHGNSVQLVGSHEFLVSMRNTWAAYLVDINTGKVVWTLGGRNSSFTVPSNAQFEFQHNAQLLPGNEVTVFDDHCCAIVGAGKFAPATGQSRGLVLKLNYTNHTASLVHQYTHNPPINAAFTGSTQTLPNGNALVGWGSAPYFSEYSSSGKLLLDAKWPGVDLSYRVLLGQTWVGTPSYPPSGAARRSHRHTWVYASWDGATTVAKWQVLAGPNSGALKVVATAAKGGYETAIYLNHSYGAYRTRALAANGRVLGTSGVFPKPTTIVSTPGY